ncbi:MAG: DUF554 domain-containing protein [Clostridia bacterium]|nr:DUF554 domain-containing protein [Clostridia bacterium]
MIGVFVNVATVLLGSLIGLFIKKGIPERVSGAVMTGIGMCNVCMGVTGVLDGENILVLIAAVAIGSVIGTLLDIDGRINRLGDWVSGRFNAGGSNSIAQGFVTASLVFCIGSMTIVGSLNSGLRGDHEMIFTKSFLDLISSSMLAASLGIGVMLSAIFVLVFQGALVLLAQFVAPFLTETAIAEMSCCGSLLILVLGLNLMGISKIKIADYLPAIFIAPIICLFL